ncbi:MAG: HAD-IIA family hydrolase [Chloroflexota bacterium]
MSDKRTLSGIKGLLLDMDGVVYRGNTPTPGAREFFQLLRSAGIRVALITNNAQRTSRQYAEKLRGMGIFVEPEAILPAGEATALYLSRRARPGARVYVIGHDGLTEPLKEFGFRLTDDRPEYVVVGLDRNFTYEKLAIACQAIRAGAHFIASNTDATLPTETSLLPGGGALVAAIEVCSGVKPLVIGKPETTMLESALARIGVAASAAAIVGDRLETDVLAGQRAGISTILVLTGVTTRDDMGASDIKPDYVFENLIELRAALEGAR